MTQTLTRLAVLPWAVDSAAPVQELIVHTKNVAVTALFGGQILECKDFIGGNERGKNEKKRNGSEGKEEEEEEWGSAFGFWLLGSVKRH